MYDFDLSCLFLVFLVEFIVMDIKEVMFYDKKIKLEEFSRNGVEVVFNVIEDI